VEKKTNRSQNLADLQKIFLEIFWDEKSQLEWFEKFLNLSWGDMDLIMLNYNLEKWVNILKDFNEFDVNWELLPKFIMSRLNQYIQNEISSMAKGSINLLLLEIRVFAKNPEFFKFETKDVYPPTDKDNQIELNKNNQVVCGEKKY